MTSKLSTPNNFSVEPMEMEFAERKSIRIMVPVDVRSFSGIARVAEALAVVDRVRADSERSAQFEPGPSRTGYDLISFRVNSDPEVVISASSNWLVAWTAMIAVGGIIRDYSTFKKSVREMHVDAGRVFTSAKQLVPRVAEAIGGLSDHFLEQVKLGAQLYLDELVSMDQPSQRIMLARAIRLSEGVGVSKGARPDVVALPE